MIHFKEKMKMKILLIFLILNWIECLEVKKFCYKTKTNCPKCTTPIPQNIGSMFSKRTIYDTFVKPKNNHVAMPQNEYLLKLHNKCSKQDVVYVKNDNKNGPFGC